MSYTVIGDAVNLAARLESFNKQWGTSVMLSEDVAAEVGNCLVLRLVIYARVVGRATPLGIYDIAGMHPNAMEHTRALRAAADAGAQSSASGDDDDLRSTASMSFANSVIGGGGLTDAVSSSGGGSSDLADVAQAGVAYDSLQRLRLTRLVAYHHRRYPCRPEVMQFVETYQEAATALRTMRFADAAAVLRGLVETDGAIPDRREYRCGQSVQTLLELAESLAVSPPSFDDLYEGEYVYRAVEK
jgi:hypothetical protein